MIDQRAHQTSASAIQSLLQAEMDASAAVEAARLKAEKSLEEANAHARGILAVSERRIQNIYAHSSQSREEISRQVQAGRDAQLQHLQTSWKVVESGIDQAVLAFARDLVGGNQNPGGA
jgi:vacuolar-type H+-ATPase subunit H